MALDTHNALGYIYIQYTETDYSIRVYTLYKTMDCIMHALTTDSTQTPSTITFIVSRAGTHKAPNDWVYKKHTLSPPPPSLSLSSSILLPLPPDDDEVMLNVLRCQLTYSRLVVTNAEAWFNNSLRPRKPEGSLGRTAEDGHLDSHTAPELSLFPLQGIKDVYSFIPLLCMEDSQQ